MEIKVICGNCGEVLKASPEVKSGEIIINLNEDHSCRTFGSRNNAETLARIEDLEEKLEQMEKNTNVAISDLVWNLFGSRMDYIRQYLIVLIATGEPVAVTTTGTETQTRTKGEHSERIRG